MTEEDETILTSAQEKIISVYNKGIAAGIKEPLIIVRCDTEEIQINGYEREDLIEKLGSPESLSEITENPGTFWCFVVHKTSCVFYEMTIVRSGHVGHC